LYFLVSHPNKDWHITEIAKNAGENVRKENAPHIIDEKTLGQLWKECKDCQAEIDEAEESKSNKGSEWVDRIRQKQEKIFSEINSVTDVTGKRRRFRTPETQAKERISKRIDRALDQLKEHSEDAARHFRNSLSPLNSYTIAYRPNPKPDWHFK